MKPQQKKVHTFGLLILTVLMRSHFDSMVPLGRKGGL